MGLIKWITLSKGKIKQEKELKQEEHLILREMAQERLAKKRALEQKQKEFDTMLDMHFPCENIVRLRTDNYLLDEFDYYLMDTMPLTMLLLIQEGAQDIPCSFKQLTGIGAGNIYKGRYNPHREDDGTHMYLNPLDRSKLTVSISGYRNSEIEQHFAEKTELEKIYGKTITLRQLLIRWKTDNRKFMNIDLENDYDMVKRVYDSEDILAKSKSEELSK